MILRLSMLGERCFSTLKAKKAFEQLETTWKVKDIMKTMNFTISEQTQDGMVGSYFKQMSTLSMGFITKQQAIAYHESNKTLKILSFNIKVLSDQTQYKQPQKKFLYNTFFYNCSIAKILMTKQYPINQQYLLTLIDYMNSHMMLLKKDKKIIILYFNMIANARRLFRQDKSNQYTSQRMAWDHALGYRYSQSQISFMLFYAGRFGVQIGYFQKSEQIITYLLSQVSMKWYQQKYALVILKAIRKFSIITKLIVDGCFKIIEGNRQIQLKVIALIVLLQRKQISSEELKEQKYNNLFQNLLQHPKQLFSQTLSIFYRSQIWIQQYWIEFFNWICQQQNPTHIKIYDIYVIFKLLTIYKAQIPLPIQTAGAQCKTCLLHTHNMRIQDTNLIKQYMSQYSTVNRRTNCQNQLANSLRLINKGSIRTEQLGTKIYNIVGFFIVDILINNKVVIEVNSRLHYIKNITTGVQSLSEKSVFRRRVIQKMGYTFYDIAVDQFSGGTFQFIEKIYQVKKDLF